MHRGRVSESTGRRKGGSKKKEHHGTSIYAYKKMDEIIRQDPGVPFQRKEAEGESERRYRSRKKNK